MRPGPACLATLTPATLTPAILTLAILTLAILTGQPLAHAQQARFDAQIFRPTAAPRDLVTVQKSELIAHMSPTLGIFQDFGVDPLVLVSRDTGQTLRAVSSRLQLTGLVGIGLFDWLDLQMAVPFIARQTSDNLRALGTEGPVQSSALGDVRVSARVALPHFHRKRHVHRGFGMALAGNLNLPTGNMKAFAGDDVLTGGLTLIADYRFGLGAIVTANAGVWLRPERTFAGMRTGDMASVGVAGETYVVQRWGLSVISALHAYPSLQSFPDDPGQIPAELLMGLRWQTRQGITLTFGGSFGAACGFGAAAVRFFSGVTWQPKTSREQEAINRILERESHDPDGDGLVGDADRCPYEPGPPENHGCPDVDTDGDGVVDREDACPNVPAGAHGRDGCPLAVIEGDEIVVLDKVHFATDSDVILTESTPVLEAVAEVLLSHPEILEVRIEGHTDVRARDSYNLALSQRRVNSVKAALIERGVDPSRLQARGFGYTQPLYDDRHCNLPDERLDEACRQLTSQNRRVVFRILLRRDDQPAASEPPPARHERR